MHPGVCNRWCKDSRVKSSDLEDSIYWTVALEDTVKKRVFISSLHMHGPELCHGRPSLKGMPALEVLCLTGKTELKSKEHPTERSTEQ